MDFLTFKQKQQVVPRNYLWWPPEVVKKYNFCLCCADPGKSSSRRLVKVLNTTFKGLSKNIFPQFAGPFKRMLRYFPLPFFRSFRTASANSNFWMLLRCRISSAMCSHRLPQPSTHSFPISRYTISVLDNLHRSSFFSASSISHPTASASSTALLPR